MQEVAKQPTEVRKVPPYIKEGFDTADILQGLYRASENTQKLLGNNLIILDTEAAITYTKLKKIDELADITTLIDKNISSLPKDREKNRDSYLQTNSGISSKIAKLKEELQKEIIPLYEKIRQLHENIHDLIPETGDLSKENKEKMVNIIQEIKDKTREIKKTCEDYNTKYQDIQFAQAQFFKEVTRRSLAEAGPAIAAPSLSNQ